MKRKLDTLGHDQSPKSFIALFSDIVVYNNLFIQDYTAIMVSEFRNSKRLPWKNEIADFEARIDHEGPGILSQKPLKY